MAANNPIQKDVIKIDKYYKVIGNDSDHEDSKTERRPSCIEDEQLTIDQNGQCLLCPEAKCGKQYQADCLKP